VVAVALGVFSVGALAVPGGPVHTWIHCNIDRITGITSTATKADSCAVGTSSSLTRYPVPPGMEGTGVPTATSATASSSVGDNLPQNAIDGNLNDNWNSGGYSGTLTVNDPHLNL